MCHGDGCRTSNAAGNLRYGTRSENALDRHAHGTMNPPHGEAHTGAKLDNETVRWVRTNAGSLGQREMGRHLGVCHSTVAAVLSGQSWAHVGRAA